MPLDNGSEGSQNPRFLQLGRKFRRYKVDILSLGGTVGSTLFPFVEMYFCILESQVGQSQMVPDTNLLSGYI